MGKTHDSMLDGMHDDERGYGHAWLTLCMCMMAHGWRPGKRRRWRHTPACVGAQWLQQEVQLDWGQLHHMTTPQSNQNGQGVRTVLSTGATAFTPHPHPPPPPPPN